MRGRGKLTPMTPLLGKDGQQLVQNALSAAWLTQGRSFELFMSAKKNPGQTLSITMAVFQPSVEIVRRLIVGDGNVHLLPGSARLALSLIGPVPAPTVPNLLGVLVQVAGSWLLVG